MRLDRVGDLNGEIEQLVPGERFSLDSVAQGAALQVFHHEKRTAGGGVDVVERADIGMVECGNGASLALEALYRDGVAGELFGEKLQRDGAAQTNVFGLVDDTHAASTEDRKDPVMGDRGAYHAAG